jgi:uncharacterized protein (DUF1697 family)
MNNKTERQKYVALLRGINVGGHHKVPMAALRETLEKMGFQQVKTLLNTGNISFEAEKQDEKGLAAKIATQLEKTFGFPVPVIIRKADEIGKVVAANPFEKINVTKATRLYVSFLPDVSKSKLTIPYTSSDESFTIISVMGQTVFSVLNLDKSGTVDAMKILEKEFGKNITTRNWNTVVKITQM